MQRLCHQATIVLSLFSLFMMNTASYGAIVNHNHPRQRATTSDLTIGNVSDETSQQRFPITPAVQKDLTKRLKRLIGSRDAGILAMPNGEPILSVYGDRLLIPASILKVLTALVALQYLGDGYRFATDFYIDDAQNLKIKGYGDPLLVSEYIVQISQELAQHIDRVKDIIIDDSYFQNNFVIPGKNNSLEPYDAPNGALCVNFNTVAFKKIDDVYVSDEAQTPLLPFALSKVKSSGLSKGRIMLANQKDENIQYAGELFRYFLVQAGIEVSGEVRRGQIGSASELLLLHYLSPVTLEEIIGRLMEYSNNFIANQLIIASGARKLGAPATLAKGVQVAERFVNDHVKLKTIRVVEGSGLSRQNRMSAEAMIKLLQRFAPYYHLLRKKGNEYYKTGTLSDVKSRAGYLEAPDGQRYPFAMLVNTPGKSTKTILDMFKRTIGGIRKKSSNGSSDPHVNR